MPNNKIEYIKIPVLIITAILTFVIFGISIFLQLFNNSVSIVWGNIVWCSIYLVMPIAVIAISLILTFTKCTAKTVVLFSAIFLIIYAASSFGTYKITGNYLSIFSYEKWEKYPNERYRMVEDLTDKYAFVGMTAEEVTNILGEPEPPYADPESKDILEYKIASFSIDPTMITFELENNEVVEVYKYTEHRVLKENLY